MWIEHFDAVILGVSQVDLIVEGAQTLHVLQAHIFTYPILIAEIEEAKAHECTNGMRLGEGDGRY